MQFKYVAVSEGNKKTSGTLSAFDKAQAISMLRARRLIPVSVVDIGGAKQEPKSVWQMELTKKDSYKIKISKKKLVNLIGQMAIMLKAGVTLLLAMDVLIEGEKDKHIKKILSEVQSDLYAGLALSKSLSKFAAFPEIMVSMIGAGEIDGRLDRSFSEINIIFEKEMQLTSKVKGAMAYPAFLMAMTLIVVGILNAIVLPTFTNLFAQMDTELPAMTKFIMASSDFLSSYWMFLVLFVVLIVFTYLYARKKSPDFCMKTDSLKLRIPLFGKLLRVSYIARFCRILASMVLAGADIITALSISRTVISNARMRKAIEDIIEDVRLGNTIYASMSKHDVFDSLLVSMVRAGEESGYLSETLDKMSTMYQNRLDDDVKTLTTLMEPAMTVIMAVIVGFVVISIAMPMFGMYSAMSAL